MKLQTLDDFIDAHLRVQSVEAMTSNDSKAAREFVAHNAYVKAPGFKQLYVRWGRRYLGGIVHADVLDIANVVARKPGNGAFTRLSEDLFNRDITVYVECVLNVRFVDKLRRMGFTEVATNGSLGSPSFYRLAQTNEEERT